MRPRSIAPVEDERNQAHLPPPYTVAPADVAAGIDHDGLELAAEQAALGVLVGDHHQHRILQHALGDRHRAGQRVQHADLDGFLRLGSSDAQRGQRGQCQGLDGE